MQAKPAQGPAWLKAVKAEPNFLNSKQEPEAASRTGGKGQVQQQSSLQYQKNDLVTLLWVLSMSYMQEPNLTDKNSTAISFKCFLCQCIPNTDVKICD